MAKFNEVYMRGTLRYFKLVFGYKQLVEGFKTFVELDFKPYSIKTMEDEYYVDFIKD